MESGSHSCAGINNVITACDSIDGLKATHSPFPDKFRYFNILFKNKISTDACQCDDFQVGYM